MGPSSIDRAAISAITLLHSACRVVVGLRVGDGRPSMASMKLTTSIRWSACKTAST